jgi:hypothetical protein
MARGDDSPIERDRRLGSALLVRSRRFRQADQPELVCADHEQGSAITIFSAITNNIHLEVVFFLSVPPNQTANFSRPLIYFKR